MVDSEKKERNDFFRQLLFIVTLVCIGLIIWKQLGFLVNSFLGASTLYIVLRSIHFKLVEKNNWKPWLSSLLLVSCALVMLLALFFLVFEVVAAQVPDIHKEDIVVGFEKLHDTINGFLGFNLMSKDIFNQVRSVLSGLASDVLDKTYNVVINFIFMIIILYFMLAKSREMEKTLMKYMPFSGKYLGMITKEIRTMVYSNAIGIPVVMAAQALVAGIGYWIIGLDNVIFLAFITSLFGLVPLIGTAAVWIPLTIYQFAVGNIWQGVVLGVYSIVVIANIDYVCRSILMKAMTNTHPLVVIFGVLLGIPLFGFWGIIFGPLLISCFLLLIKIYHIQYNQ